MMLKDFLVLGSGSAGLIAALSLKVKLPQLRVRILRSSAIGIIGVGEGTTPNFPSHLFDFIGLNRKHFWDIAKPTWKLGIRFLWGPRSHFDYTFDKQLDMQLPQLPLPNGYYCESDFSRTSLPAALMGQGKVFGAQENGCPDIQGWHAMHIENELLVDYLEMVAKNVGIEFIEGVVSGVQRVENGDVASVVLEDGQVVSADFFIDASGFRSELLGRALEQEFESFGGSLFCDRAVAGGWEREEEPILPYTTAETMNSGWAWQIEHEHHINRGYVYSSAFISDEQAVEEFCRKNPKAPKAPRIIQFKSGYYKQQWVNNVVAIGNSGGFVEPLEATALMIVCGNAQLFVEMLMRSQCQPTESMKTLFNDLARKSWHDIRDFLALHYKYNTRLNTPFWQHCQNETDLSAIDPLIEFYKENGPTGFCRFFLESLRNDFGLEGYLVMLVGNKVPYRSPSISTNELALWKQHQQHLEQQANKALTVKEALAYVHHPQWTWHGDA